MTGTVTLRWHPEPRIEFEFDVARGREDSLLAGGSGDADGELVVSHGRRGVASPYMYEYFEDTVRISGEFRPVQAGQLTRTRRIKTHVINFPVTNGPEELELLGSGWRLILKDLNPELFGSARDPSTYIVTGALAVERIDGELFDGVDGLEILEAFDHFATLCRGAWAGHALPFGIGENRTIAWDRWQVSRIDRTGLGDGWATERNEGPVPMVQMWPGFLTRWQDESRRETLQTLTSLLTSASVQAERETGLLIADVALELLSWAGVVGDRGMLSAEGHDRLLGADRCRLLLAVSGIDASVPPEMSDLARVASKSHWADGPQAIAEIRNMVVHPIKRTRMRDVPPNAVGQANSLALLYARAATLWLLSGSLDWPRFREDPVPDLLGRSF